MHHSISGVDLLKQLQTVYKFKLNTISEALSVTSFEVSTPRFLFSSGSHSVIGNKASYFLHIANYCKWNNPSSGYKLCLEKELKQFCRSHLTTIRERVVTSSLLCHVATSSLNDSITWATGLIKYIDNT